MAHQIQIRRDTAANWASSNPILAQGEPGLDLTTDQIRIGDGTSNWADLPVAMLSATAVAALITAAQGTPVTVSALPAEPVAGTRYYLDTTDDTAHAAPGIYRHDGTRWWMISGSTYTYTGTLGATLTLPDIYDAIYEITLSEALTLTLPTARKGGSETLIVTNAGDYPITLPAGTKTDTDYAGDETGLCVYELACIDAAAWTWLLAASGVSA